MVKDGESLQERPRSGRPPSVATPWKKQVPKGRIRNDPTTSLRAHSRDMGISTRTMRRMANDIGAKSLVKLRVPLLSEMQKTRRLEHSQALLDELKRRPEDTVFFFSDEKNFLLEPVHNRRNDRVLQFKGEEDVPERLVRHTKHPASLMFLGVVASTGHVSPPIFFERGFRLGQEKYLEKLKDLVPWMKGIAGGRPLVFQQDLAPAHSARSVQRYLEDQLGRDGFWSAQKWPACSPDLNPLDFSI